MLLARARVHVTERVTLEGVYLPDFRRGRFDQLDEPTSPFNLPVSAAEAPVVCLAIGCPTAAIPLVGASARLHREERTEWRAGVGDDWPRGLECLGVSRLRIVRAVYARLPPSFLPSDPPTVTVVYPRFTMIGADFEAVRGKWGLRGEVAAFVDDNFQSPDLRVVAGRSVDGGVGVDRRAGDYTLSGTVLVHSESYDSPLAAAGVGRDAIDGRTDVSLVVSANRTFARERYRLRGFGVYNATEASGFLRGIAMASLRDNVALEASLGWFAGAGRDWSGASATATLHTSGSSPSS